MIADREFDSMQHVVQTYLTRWAFSRLALHVKLEIDLQFNRPFMVWRLPSLIISRDWCTENMRMFFSETYPETASSISNVSLAERRKCRYQDCLAAIDRTLVRRALFRALFWLRSCANEKLKKTKSDQSYNFSKEYRI